MTKIAVLGPGGVGGLIAAALVRAGQSVTVVARETTAAAIAQSGIEVESVRLGSFAAWPAVIPLLGEEVDLLFVATKATTLAPALDRIERSPGLVIPLLNGLEHMELLRERFGAERVAAGVIRVESSAPRPGRIRQTSPFLRVDLASDDPGRRAALVRAAELLSRAGIPTQVEASEAQVLWSKLTRLVALALTTSASGRTIGFIRSDPEWRETLVSVIDEAAAVAVADGARIDPAATLAELDEAHPELGSSMQRDLAAGREPELDAIAGAVIRAARRRGIDCPTLERLSLQVAEAAGLTQPRA